MKFMSDKSIITPQDVPRAPYRTFRKHPDYLGIAIFMGWGTIIKGNYWPYIKSEKFIKKLNIKNYKMYSRYCNGEYKNLPSKPLLLPRSPDVVYKNKGWKGWPDFLGYKLGANRQLNEYYSFPEAKKFVQKLKSKKFKNGILIIVVENIKIYLRNLISYQKLLNFIIKKNGMVGKIFLLQKLHI